MKHEKILKSFAELSAEAIELEAAQVEEKKLKPQVSSPPELAIFRGKRSAKRFRPGRLPRLGHK